MSDTTIRNLMIAIRTVSLALFFLGVYFVFWGKNLPLTKGIAIMCALLLCAFLTAILRAIKADNVRKADAAR